MKTYLYAHVNPETAHLVYIGIGVGERAATTHRRSKPHAKFLTNLQEMGYTPFDYTVVLAQGLSCREARALESSLITRLAPMFNQMGLSAANAGRGVDNHNAVLTPDTIREIRTRHKAGGISIRALGREYGVAYTTARKVVKGLAWTHINED